MFQQDNDRSLREHKELEAALHREIMNCSRKYLNKLGIVSIVGIMDIVKQEIVELEKATKKSVDTMPSNDEENQIDGF